MPPLAALLLALALWAGAAPAQQVADLSLPDARRLAVAAATQGEDPLALALARALLDADPRDRDALAVLALVLPRQGDPVAGRRAAVRAYALSRTPAERHEAARLAAAAAFAGANYPLAEIWLRAALVHAPTPAARDRTLADARTLRARSPWRLDLEFGLQPSDNVNGGAESPFNVIDGLPFVGRISVDGRALSGWVGSLDARLARRLLESPRERLDLSVRLSGRAVALSRDSRDLIAAEAPDAGITGADFGARTAEIRLAHLGAWPWGVAGADATLGRTWPGEGEPVDFIRLSGSAGLDLSPRQAVRLALSAEERRGRPADDQTRLGAEIGWTTALREGDRLTLAASRSLTLSDVPNQASDGWGLRATYALGDPVGPARLSATLGAAWTDYPDYAVIFPVPGGREDARASLSIQAAFQDWSVAGFAPVLSIEAARTDSNVSRFDTETLGLGLTFRSTF